MAETGPQADSPVPARAVAKADLRLPTLIADVKLAALTVSLSCFPQYFHCFPHDKEANGCTDQKIKVDHAGK